MPAVRRGTAPKSASTGHADRAYRAAMAIASDSFPVGEKVRDGVLMQSSLAMVFRLRSGTVCRDPATPGAARLSVITHGTPC